MEFIIELQEGDEELCSQLDTLLSTRAGSVPVVRDYGINWDCLDAPPEVAESLFHQELLNKVEVYIPRLQIKGVVFEHHPQTGGMCARISCQRRENRE